VPNNRIVFRSGTVAKLAAAGLFVALLPWIVASTATAAGSPAITLSETIPATVLYGSPATITLTATNPTITPAYNASFEDTLPAGITYVPGSVAPSTLGAPTVITNADGTTTLIWANAADLQPSSSASITFGVQSAVEPSTSALYPGSSFSDSPSVYVNTDPHTVPTFSPTGAPSTFTGSATPTTPSPGTPTSTQVVPITIAKSQSRPEAELPRGVQQNTDEYTVTVTNSAEDATDNTLVTDYLPAGLEFLGCGTTDNTTDASGTNPGSIDEYPGSGPLGVGQSDTSATCTNPQSVDTVQLAPSGGDGSPPAQPVTVESAADGGSTYTEVVWNAGDLAPMASETFTYLAAVPLRENTDTWSGATPDPTSDQQGSNLDNNNGAETADGQSETNLAVATGDYQGPVAAGGSKSVSASTDQSIEAVDLAVQKTDSSSTFTNGAVHTYTLNYETSEYRSSSDVVLTDALPDGQCPLGSSNYDPQADPACNPQTGVAPDPGYTSVAETPSGGFALTWDLGVLPTDTDGTVTFPAVDRSSYQGSTGPTTPTLTGDGYTDHASITGLAVAACQNGQPGGQVCPPGDSSIVYTGESTPETPVNGSQATETAPEPTLTKSVAIAPADGTAVNCANLIYTTTATPTYQKGDTVCFQITVDFPAGATNRNVDVTDFLPPNSTYVPGSEVTSASSPVSAFTAPSAGSSELSWSVGGAVPGGAAGDSYVGPNPDGSGQVFQAELAVIPSADPSAGNSFALTANLAKETQLDTDGNGISLRSSASYQLSRPIVTVAKAVTTLAGKANTVTTPTVTDGEATGYTITLTNTGLIAALNTATSDTLPPQVTCAALSAISNGGHCAGTSPSVITWSGLTVPAATESSTGAITAGTQTLTYVVTLPSTLVANESLTNNTSVTSYQSQPNNDAPPNTYTPGTDGSPTATASATVKLAPPTVKKTVTPTSATIGQTVAYTIVTTIPAGTTFDAGVLSDPLGPDEAYVAGSAVVAVTGASTPPATPANLQPAYTSATNTLAITLPLSLTVPTTGPLTVTLTYSATISNVAANTRTSSVRNTASLGYDNSVGTAQTPITSSTTVTVDEPDIRLAKTDNTGGHAEPGASVDFTVTVTNQAVTDGSTAYDIVAVDTLPPGMAEPTNISNNGLYAASSDPAADSGTITWTLPTTASLAPGASLPLTYTAVLPYPGVGNGTVTNNASATVTSQPAGGRTAGTGYSATASDTITLPGASVTKSATPPSVAVGVDTTYTATVNIPRGIALPNLTAIDTLPDGMVFDAYGTATCTRADGTACGTDIADQALNSAAGSPTAGADGTTPLAWFIGDVTSDTQARTVTLTYTAHPAEQTSAGTTVVAGNVFSNQIATYWNQTTGPDPTVVPAPSSFQEASPTATASVTVVAPDLSILKTVSNATPTPGAPGVTWTLTVTNSTAATSSAAYDVVINDPLPAGLDAPTGISNGGVFTPSGSATGSPGTITWTLPGPIGTTAPSDQVSLSFTTELDSAAIATGQQLSNTATIAGYDGVSGGNATDPSRYPTYGPTSSTASINPVFPQLAITKSTASGAPTAAAAIGQPFGWKLTVTGSAVPASNVTVADTLPAGWTYDAGSAQLNGAPLPVTDVTVSGVVVTFSLPGPVSSSATDVITYDATPGPNAGAGDATPDTNSATVAGTDASGAPGNASAPYQAGPANASATIASADLAVTKTAVGSVIPGSPATYNLAVTNHGPDAAAGPITVVDILPAGATAVSGVGTGWTCQQGAGAGGVEVLTCTSSSAIADGVGAPALTVTLTVPASTTGSVTNTATVSSPTHDPASANNASSVPTAVDAVADLSVAKSHDGDFTAGQDGSYLLAVRNNGPSDAAGPITVTDTLPAGETFVSAVDPTNVWTCSGDPTSPTVTCTRPGPLAAGTAAAGVVLTVAVDPSVTEGTVIDNTATVGEAETDPNTANNQASDPTMVDASADLAIVKSHAATIEAGTSTAYTLAVTDLGPSDAAGPITVSDTLPSSETYEPSSGGGTGAATWSCTARTATPTVVTCTLPGPLPVGPAPSITLDVAVSPGVTGTITNTATVSSPTADPDPANDSSTSVGPQIQVVDNISLTKTAQGHGFVAGEDGTYDLSVTNGGPSDDPGPYTVVDTLPPQETFVSAAGAGWSCQPGTAPASPKTVTCTEASGLTLGASSPFTMTVAVSPAYIGGVLTNTATVSSPVADPNETDNTARAQTPVTTSADLSLTKTTTDALTPGTTGTYTLAVSNAGPSDAQAPTIVDTLPAGETLVSATSVDGWTCTGSSTITCDGPSPLPVSSNTSPATTIVVEVAVDPGYTAGPITNTAQVSSPTPDPVLPNDTASATTTSAPSADLSITKTHGGNFTAGQPGTYTVVVANNGPSGAAAPTVVDTLPTGESFVSAAGPGWTCASSTSDTASCAYDSILVSGATATITVTVDVAPTIPDGSVVVNQATVSSTTADPDATNNTASDPTTVGATADLAVTKTDADPTLIPGHQTTYDLSVSNAGPSDAAGPITVTDHLPAGETYVSGTGGTGADLWTCTADTAGTTVSCTLPGPLAAGTAAAPFDAPAIDLAVMVGAAAYPSVTNTAAVTSPTADPLPGNNRASATTPVASVADLTLTKTAVGLALAGGNLSYTLAVTNVGPTPDPGPVTVTDPLPVGEKWISATGVGWACPTPVPSGPATVVCTRPSSYPVGLQTSITLMVELSPAAVPTATNTASVAGQGTDPDPANNIATSSVTVAPVANLLLAKSLTSAGLVTGAAADYALTVTDQGPSPTSGTLTVTDPLPAGLSYVQATGPGWTCSALGSTLTCSTGQSLAAGATSTITLAVTVTATSGTITNQAMATGPNQTSTAGDAAATPPIVVAAAPSTGPVRGLSGSGPPATGVSGSSPPAAGPSPTGGVSATGPAPLQIPASTSSTLAFTGLDVERSLGTSMVLILGGLALVALARRRRGPGRARL
jgi:large repetitive protein